jgi:glutamyl-Q tRNA(Asp) synthetase
LEGFELDWDGEIYYQSQHIEQYQTAIKQLDQQQALYQCYCSRKQLINNHAIYPGFCRHQAAISKQEFALRIKTYDQTLVFNDLLQGEISENMASQHGDFIIQRKDQIIAYQLAVVIDDHLQGVNHVVRGYDLLESTAKQIYLHQLVNYQPPIYMHVPIIVDQQGQKLSKQSFAQAVEDSNRSQTLWHLLNLLKQHPPQILASGSVKQILQWAIENWQPQQLSAITSIS